MKIRFLPFWLSILSSSLLYAGEDTKTNDLVSNEHSSHLVSKRQSETKRTKELEKKEEEFLLKVETLSLEEKKEEKKFGLNWQDEDLIRGILKKVINNPIQAPLLYPPELSNPSKSVQQVFKEFYGDN